MDLGPCPKSHTARLKDDFNAALAKGERFPQFQAEHEHNIYSFIDDVDRKINANKRRLDQTPEENAKFTNLMREIGEIEVALQAAMGEVETLGEAGQIEESLAELQKAEALKAEKADKEKELQILTENSGASGHQKLRVCDVCGAYLSILDSDRRLADHFGGKMHLGYLRLREMIKEFEKRRNPQPAGPPPSGPAPMNGVVSNGPPAHAPMGPRGATREAGELDDGRERDYDRERERRDRDRRESRDHR